MSKGLFYTTRAIDGREGKNLCRHLTILKHTHDTVDMLTGNSDESIKKAEPYGHFKISSVFNHYGNFYSNDAKNMENWMAVYDAINPIALKDYDALYLIGGLDLHRSNLGRKENRVGVFPHDRDQLKFESCGIHLTNILALVKAHNTYGIPLHELAFDPNEMSCDLFHVDVAPVKDSGYYLYHGYDIPKYGAHRLDSLQHWLQANKHPQFPEDYSQKSVDFTFGYTVLKNSGREHYPQAIDAVVKQFTRSIVFVKNEYDEMTNDVYLNNELVDKKLYSPEIIYSELISKHTRFFILTKNLVAADRYLDLVKKSRFTYMLPSYDKHCFSVYRFLESLHHDCLPLIHPDCNIADIGKSFGVSDIFSELQSGKIPSENRRMDIIHQLKGIMLVPTNNFENSSKIV